MLFHKASIGKTFKANGHGGMTEWYGDCHGVGNSNLHCLLHDRHQNSIRSENCSMCAECRLLPMPMSTNNSSAPQQQQQQQ
jgi:hypothetical protein